MGFNYRQGFDITIYMKTYQNISPAFLIRDSKGREIIDSRIPDMGVTSFSYSFNETEADSCSITLNLTNVAQYSAYQFRQYSSLYVSWGYIGYMRNPIKVIITKVTESYSASGLTLTIGCSDDFSVLTKSSSPQVMEAEKLKAYLDRISHLGLLVEAIKQGKAGKTQFFYPTTGKSYETKRITDELGLTDVLAATDMAQGYGPHTRASLEKNGYVDNTSRDKEFEKNLWVAKLIDQESGEGKSELNTTKLLEFFKLKPGTVVEGSNPKEIITNMLTQAEDGPWNVTGSNGKVVIHNRGVNVPSVREFIFGGEPGTFLSFDYNSDAKYSGESILKKLAVDPKTGALTVKEYANALSEEKYRDANTPTQFALATKQTEFTNRLIEAIGNGSIANRFFQSGSEKEIGQDGYSIEQLNNSPLVPLGYVSPVTPQFDIAGTGITAPYGQGSGMAIDNAQLGPIMAWGVITPALQDMAEAADQVLENLKKEGSGERAKVTAKFLGDPYLPCSENITLKGLGKHRNGQYHITSCTHHIDSGGYLMDTEMYPVSFAIDNIVTSSYGVDPDAIKDANKKSKSDEAKADLREKNGLERFEVDYGGSYILPGGVAGNLSASLNAKGPIYVLCYTDTRGEHKCVKVRIFGDPQRALQSVGVADMMRVFPDYAGNPEVLDAY